VHRRRLVIGFLALGLTASAVRPSRGDWPQEGQNPQKTHSNRAERTLDATNASKLEMHWVAKFPESDITRGVAVANGSVYVTHDDGLTVFPLDCGTSGAECSPLWTTDEAAFSPPVVAGDFVFVGYADIWAYPAAGCGQPICDPVRTFVVDAGSVDTITVAGHMLVATVFGGPFVVFDTAACFSDVCEPAWTADLSYREAGGAAVANGLVYVGKEAGGLSAFDLDGCGQPTCGPVWVGVTTANTERTPAVADGFVFALSQTREHILFVFPATGCGQSHCAAVWQGMMPGIGDPGDGLAVAGGFVYATSDSPARIAAFRTTGCGSLTCRPDKAFDLSSSSGTTPSLANGVLYAASGGVLDAFDVTCIQSPCQPIASPPATGDFPLEVIISNGTVVVRTSAGVGVLGLS
jgi:outer membrane protein assembly factor BamB